MARPNEIGVVCYDLDAVSRFFRSVAMALSLQQHTSTEWVEYRDSAVLNAFYAVAFWKEGPGSLEVRTGSNVAIDRTAAELHERFLLAWLQKLATGGPSAANDYVAEMGRLRERARIAVNEVFQEARNVNDAVIKQTTTFIKQLSYVRLGASVGVAVIGGIVGVAYVAAAASGGLAAGGLTVLGVPAGASATQFGLVGLGTSVTKTIVKTWEEAPKAKVAAVMIDGAKYTAGEVGGKLAEGAAEKAVAQQARSKAIIKSAEKMIDKQSKRLAQQSIGKKGTQKAVERLTQAQVKFARESENLARAGSVVKNAPRIGMSLPVVFAAWDIMDAFTEHAETMKSLR